MARQAFDGAIASVGEGNKLTSFVRQTLGTALLETGNAVEARKLFAEALAVREKSLQPGSNHIVNSLRVLAEADFALHNVPLAAAETGRAVRMYEATLGPSNVLLAKAQTVIAEIDGLQERWTDAQSMAERALAADRSGLPTDHPATARAQSDLGWALWKQGESSGSRPGIGRGVADESRSVARYVVYTSVGYGSQTLGRVPPRDGKAPRC